MKKINKLMLLIVAFILITFNVHADAFSTVVSDTATTCNDYSCDVESYTIQISSNDLEDVTGVQAYSPEHGFTYIDNDYQIYAEKYYEYSLKTNNGNLNTFDGEIEILIKDENLLEDNEYNVYYFSTTYPRTLNKTKVNDRAKVVNINGELYIKLVTDTLEAFALEKDVSNEYKEKFDRISENGFYIFPAVKPKQTIDDGFDFYTFFGAVANRKLPYTIWPADEFKKENEYQYMSLEFNDLPGEVHIVKYKWQEDDVPSNLKKEINEIEKNILDNTKPLSNFESSLNGVYFEIEDLNYINYIYNSDDKNNEGVIPYSSDIKKIFKYNNFKYHFDFRAGNDTPFYNHMFGYMLVEKKDLLYSMMFNVGIAIKPVIYIPDNTKDTDEAYIEAALKRVKEYLEIDNITMSISGKRTDLEQEYPQLSTVWNRIYNENKLSDNYYTLNINGIEKDFLIEKNSKKAKEMEFKTKDLESDVEINTTSGLIPLDTSIEVEIIGKDHKEYNKILEIIKKDNADIYDLKLFSESKDKYVTQLPNGKFKVKIPLKDEYKNKNLKVYYVGDSNEPEVFEVVVEDEYAVFETTHFSTYTLAVDEIPNPPTYDGIRNFQILGIVSFIGLVTSSIYLKKKIKNA